MGGTSTDVSRFDGKDYSHVFDTKIAGIHIQTPHLDINTVAAGFFFFFYQCLKRRIFFS